MDELEITGKGQRSLADRVLQKNVLKETWVASARPDEMRLRGDCYWRIFHLKTQSQASASPDA